MLTSTTGLADLCLTWVSLTLNGENSGPLNSDSVHFGSMVYGSIYEVQVGIGMVFVTVLFKL